MKPRPRPRGLLDGLAPEAFESWVAERFRGLGYDVRVTPYQGDHGADLLATRAGETVVVQCKHRPAGTVGEPVLRDLFGAMHHFGATRAILVTTGRLSLAARDWLQGKPMEAWDAHDLQERWPAEIGQTAEQLAAARPPVTPAGADDGGRSGWYAYTEFGDRRYALKVPRSIGDHPDLGFEPLIDPDLPILPATVHIRQVILTKLGSTRPNGASVARTVPVGTEEAVKQLTHVLHQIELPQRMEHRQRGSFSTARPRPIKRRGSGRGVWVAPHRPDAPTCGPRVGRRM